MFLWRKKKVNTFWLKKITKVLLKCTHNIVFVSIVYNQVIVYNYFLKVVVHAIVTDQCNQTAR